MSNVITNYLNNANFTQDFNGVCITEILPSRVDCSTLLMLPMPASLPANSNIVANKVFSFSSLSVVASLIGTKNVAYTALDKAFCSCPTGRTAIHAIFLPVLATAVAAVKEFTTTAITTTHTKTIKIGSVTKSVLFTAGMTDAAAAAAIQVAFSPEPSFAYTIVAATNVVTITAKDAGEYDNLNMVYIDSRRAPQVIDSPLGALTETTAGAGGLNTTGLVAGLGNCCFACSALASSDATTMREVFTAYNSKNNVCFGTNCFGNLWMAIKGTPTENTVFGETGDAGARWNFKATTLGLLAEYQNAPYMTAVARAVISCCLGCDDPANPILNAQSIMACLPENQDCYSSVSSADFKAMWEAGITPVTVTNGYQSIARERFSYRVDANNKAITTISSPADFRVMAKYVQLLDEWVLQNFGSNYVFKENTPVQRGAAFSKLLPESMRTRGGYNMVEVKALWKNFHQQLVGIIFDEQDFDAKLQSFLDDQLRAACAGDPTALVLIGENLSRVRAISSVRSSVSLTTSSC
jgi:phage tail sheath gpL-like